MAILVMPLIVIIMVVLEVTRMAPILVMVAAMVAVREGAILTFHTGHETKTLPGGWLGD